MPSVSVPPSGTQATGRVADYASGAPIAGAVVVAGSTLVLGATPPPTIPAGDAQATTGADGSFSVPVSAGSGNVMVFATGYIALHAPETYSVGTNALNTLKISTPTADDVAWLAAINQDRATYGAAPVVMDERLTEAARLWNAYEAANGRYEDTDPGAPAPYTTSITLYGTLGTYNAPVAQNLAGVSNGQNGVDAEANFRTEGPTGHHFSTIIAPSARWVGLSGSQCQGAATAPCSYPGWVYLLDALAPPLGI